MNILLIRLRLIGDVVFTTPVIRAIKRARPDAQLTYLVEREAAAVVQGNPHLDEIIVIRRSRGLARVLDDLQLARRLRRRRFDVVIDMHGGPRSAWLTLATGAPVRIGYTIAGRTWMYTHRVPRSRALRPRHSVLNQWDLLKAFDPATPETPDPVDDAVQMTGDPQVEQRVAERLASSGVEPQHELIVVHVSAGNPFRRWPEPAFTRLIASLAAARPERRLILSSGPSDRRAAHRIANAARRELGASAAGRVVDFGDFDIAELRALVLRSRLFVGGDTGPLHVAATTPTPIVGLFGPTLPVRSSPWRDPAYPAESIGVEGLPCRPCDQRSCTPGDFRCLTTLRPDDVLAAAERLLKRTA